MQSRVFLEEGEEVAGSCLGQKAGPWVIKYADGSTSPSHLQSFVVLRAMESLAGSSSSTTGHPCMDQEGRSAGNKELKWLK